MTCRYCRLGDAFDDDACTFVLAVEQVVFVGIDYQQIGTPPSGGCITVVTRDLPWSSDPIDRREVLCENPGVPIGAQPGEGRSCAMTLPGVMRLAESELLLEIGATAEGRGVDGWICRTLNAYCKQKFIGGHMTSISDIGLSPSAVSAAT